MRLIKLSTRHAQRLFALGLIFGLIASITLFMLEFTTVSHAALMAWMLFSCGLTQYLINLRLQGWPGHHATLIGTFLYFLVSITLFAQGVNEFISLHTLIYSFFILDGLIKALLVTRIQHQLHCWHFGLTSVLGIMIGVIILKEWFMPMPWLSLTFTTITPVYIMLSALNWMMLASDNKE